MPEEVYHWLTAWVAESVIAVLEQRSYEGYVKVAVETILKECHSHPASQHPRVENIIITTITQLHRT